MILAGPVGRPIYSYCRFIYFVYIFSLFVSHFRAIMKFHSIKMAEINKIVKEYWTNTYKGNGEDEFFLQ